jgi:hypothetical protein
VKGKEELQADKDHTYDFIDEYLEESINTSNIYDSTQETDYDYCISEQNAHAGISRGNTFCKKCMNLLFLSESYHISILDEVADKCELGKRWEVLSFHNSRRANVISFYHEASMKHNLPIVSAIPVHYLPN